MVELTEAIKSSIRYAQEGIRTMIPARVVSIEYDQQKATVEIMVQRRDYNGTVTTVRPVVSVPVITFGADTGQLSFPVKPGDLGHVICMDRSIDRYIFSEGTAPIDPADRRCHKLPDAVFVPGLRTYPRAYGIDPTKTVLRHNAGENNANNPGENSLHLHPVGDTEGSVLSANRHTPDLCTIKMLQDGGVVITANEGNSNLSRVTMAADGSITIDANEGTVITMIQGGDININTQANVNVTTGGNANIDASNIVMQGGGEKMLSDASVNHATGLPHGSGCSTIQGSGGST